MLIEVTQEDIKAGLDGDCFKCPIALALNRATGKKWVVNNYYCGEIQEYGSYLFNEKILFDRTVVDWIFQFDKDSNVEPFSFELNI